MNFLVCHYFKRLARESQERDLSLRERASMDKHRQHCMDCLEYEESLGGSLQVLRSASLDLPLSDDFTMRVARKARLVQKRDTMLYWTPAVCGAGVACLVVLAVLQLASQSNEIRIMHPTTQNAMLRHTSPRSAARMLLLKGSQAEYDSNLNGP